MQRIDGFLDLGSIFGIREDADIQKIYSILSNRRDVEIIKYKYNRQILHLRFSFEGKKYFFKREAIANIYDELLYEETCDELGVICLHQDIAKLGSLTGVLSEYYDFADASVICGMTVLSESGFECSIKSSEELKKTLKNNNLVDIICALKIRYRDRENCDEIVKKLSYKLIKMFIVDVIMMELDRHPKNWQIIEYADGRVDLFPLFDNCCLSISKPYCTPLALSAIRGNCQSIDTNVQNFVDQFPKTYKYLLSRYIGVISRESLEKKFSRIERKFKFTLPQQIKETYLKLYLAQKNCLENVLDIPVNCNVYVGSFEEMLPLAKRKVDAFKVSIGIGIITPNKAIYVTDETGQIDSHESLKKLALKNLLGLGSPYDIYDMELDEQLDAIADTANDNIEVYLEFNDTTKNLAEISIPAFMTPSQAQELQILEEKLYRQGFIITISSTTIDPLIEDFVASLISIVPSPKKDSIIEQILDYYRKKGRIIDCAYDDLKKNFTIKRRSSNSIFS